MKKNIVILLVMLFGFTRCSDYLDMNPLEQPGSAGFYSNENEVMLAVNACYNYVDPSEQLRSQTFTKELIGLEDAGMERMHRYFEGFRIGNAQPTWGQMTYYWSSYYKGISRCHMTIDGMEAAKSEMESTGKGDLWNRYRAEARVIRAFCYYNLVSKFGDIPLTTSQLEMTEYADLGRTPEDQVYDFILSEIEEVVNYLPETYSGNDVGRITKGAAYAIGARTALYRAYFHNGAAISPDSKYLNIVLDYTQKIIDSGTYALYYDNTNPSQSYRNLFLYKGENSSEVILQKEFSFTAGKSHRLEESWGSRNYPNSYSACAPSEYQVMAYEDTLGNTVDKSPYFDPKNPYIARDPRLYQSVCLPRVEGDQDITVILNTASGPKTITGWNELWPGSTYPDVYNPSFIRNHKSMLKAWGDQYGKNYDNYDWYHDEATGFDVVKDNQNSLNVWSSFTGYISFKHWDFSDYPQNVLTSSLNVILIRYADVLLMNAEARIDLNNDLTKAAEYMNMIRARGYGLTLSEYLSHPSALNSGMGQSELRRRVRRERKVELAMEGLRYDDLKRYGAAVKALSQPIVGRPKFYHLEAATNIPVIDDNAVVTLPWLNGLAGAAPDYPRRWFSDSFYKEVYNRWPIPQTEFDNGNLPQEAQNPGY